MELPYMNGSITTIETKNRKAHDIVDRFVTMLMTIEDMKDTTVITKINKEQNTSYLKADFVEQREKLKEAIQNALKNAADAVEKESANKFTSKSASDSTAFSKLSDDVETLKNKYKYDMEVFDKRTKGLCEHIKVLENTADKLDKRIKELEEDKVWNKENHSCILYELGKLKNRDEEIDLNNKICQSKFDVRIKELEKQLHEMQLEMKTDKAQYSSMCKIVDGYTKQVRRYLKQIRDNNEQG